MTRNIPYSNAQRRNRHEFLLTFFDPENSYQEKLVNGHWLIKYFNKTSGYWEVMIFSSEEAFNKYKKFSG